MTTALLEAAVAPLDRARNVALKALVRPPAMRRLVASRDLRLSTLATVHAAIAALLAVLCPSALFVLGPIVLGVAHVAADVRYLVLRRRLPAALPKLVGVFCVALVALRLLGELHPARHWSDRTEFVLAGAFILVTSAFGVTGSSKARWAATAFAVLMLTGLAVLHPSGARLALTHGHNAVALVLWVWLFRGARASLLLPVILTTCVAALFASGALYTVTLHAPFASAFGLHVLAVSDYLAPELRADRAIGLVQQFLFLQSVHYAVWLVFLPQDDDAGAGLSSFRRGVRELSRDFTVVGFAAVVVLALSVAAFAAFGAMRASRVYLSLAMFHGYLELAMAAYFFCRGRPTVRS